MILAAGLLCWGVYLLAVVRHRRGIEANIARHLPLIQKHARSAGLPVDLVCAVIRAESGGDERAVSSKGAKGLMQIMPIAHRQTVGDCGGDLFDPDHNIYVGTKYLRQLMDQFGWDQVLAVAAYHMGPTRTAKLRRDHPDLTAWQLVENFAPASTRKYVHIVLAGQ